MTAVAWPVEHLPSWRARCRSGVSEAMQGRGPQVEERERGQASTLDVGARAVCGGELDDHAADDRGEQHDAAAREDDRE